MLRNPQPDKTDTERQAGERIAKAVARAGICSRREAERFIAAGRIRLNGHILTSPAVTVKPGDAVTVDGKPLQPPEPVKLWRYHKASGLVTTHRDPQGRATVFDHLPKRLPRVISIGRLDLASEGLLLLTNDGMLARRLELPATAWTRRYRVCVRGAVEKARLDRLAQGTTVEGMDYGAIIVTLDTVENGEHWLTMCLKEGKNREIRRVLQYLGLEVRKLVRTAYGPFQLGNLAREQVDEVPCRVLRDQLGAKLMSSLSGPDTSGKTRNAHRRRSS
ncbi:MAG: pseudouridine synthase [Hyphomicrobiales bacterium]